MITDIVYARCTVSECAGVVSPWGKRRGSGDRLQNSIQREFASAFMRLSGRYYLIGLDWEPSMRLRRNSMVALAALSLFTGGVVPSRVSAWDKDTTGVIGEIEVGWDGGFAVALTDGSRLCPGPAEGSWAATHALYGTSYGATADAMKAMHATLLAAKLSGTRVTLHANTNSSGANCVVGVVTLL